MGLSFVYSTWQKTKEGMTNSSLVWSPQWHPTARTYIANRGWQLGSGIWARRQAAPSTRHEQPVRVPCWGGKMAPRKRPGPATGGGGMGLEGRSESEVLLSHFLVVWLWRSWHPLCLVVSHLQKVIPACLPGLLLLSNDLKSVEYLINMKMPYKYQAL